MLTLAVLPSFGSEASRLPQGPALRLCQQIKSKYHWQYSVVD